MGNPFYQVSDKRLGDTAVYAVHRHVVAVVGGPAEREFAQVARADHHSALHVGHVHQYLRAFAGLDVFISGGSFGRIVPDVGEVPEAAFRDGDFTKFHAQKAAHGYGIVMGSVRGAETGHRNRCYFFSGIPSISKARTVTNSARVESRPPEIPSTADWQPVCSYLFFQTAGLNGQDLIAAFLPLFCLIRHKRPG